MSDFAKLPDEVLARIIDTLVVCLSLALAYSDFLNSGKESK